MSPSPDEEQLPDTDQRNGGNRPLLGDANERHLNKNTSIRGVENPKPAQMSEAERKEARKRYKEKLQAFAAARGVDSANGKPARSRSELMAARKIKEERRKARKKAARAKAKEEEEEEEDERDSVDAEASRLVGGFGAAGRAGPGSPSATENFTFGHMDTDEGRRKPKKRDLQGALAVAEKRERRLAAFDEEKRANIETKDAWRSAEQRVAGSKVKNDPTLLRRSLKRKEKAKKKGGEAWKKREEGVKAGIKARQAKREENLRKRRPGFEGTFKIAKRRV